MSEFEREQDERINLDDQPLGNQSLGDDASYYKNVKDQLSALSTSPINAPQNRTVESLIDEYLNEQIPRAKSYILTPAMNQITPGGHLQLSDRTLAQYSDMIEQKAKALLQDVLKVILQKEQKWNKSFEKLDQQQLYTQLSDEDQIRFHKIFKAKEDWKIEHIDLLKQENHAQFEQQTLNKLKLNLAQNFNIDFQERTAEAMSRTGQALDQLYQEVNIPRSAVSLLLYNSSAKDNGVTKDKEEIFTIDNSQILGSYIGKAIQETIYEGQDPTNQKKDLLAMVEQSKENVQEFASKANYIFEAYGIINQALDTVRLENNKMPDQIKFNGIVKSFMPAVLKFSPEVLHENQAILSRQLSNDLNKAIKFLSFGPKLKIDQDKLDKIATKIGNYKVEEVVAESKDEVKAQSFSADNTKESVTRDSRELPNTQDKSPNKSQNIMRTFSVSHNVLDKLVNKYQELENGVKKTYIDPKMRKKEINVLNNELYQLTTEEGVMLPINQLSTPPENLSIKELQTQAGVKYSTIGNPPSNGLIMGQAADGQFYFNESSANSKFTGLVFVERVDENTGQLLAVKDVICYSEGKVVKFIEALDGKSRLGQLEKFKQLSSSPTLEEQTVNTHKTFAQQERSELPPTSALSKPTQGNQKVTSDLSKSEPSKNVSQDHVGEQVIKKFDPEASKKLSDKELHFILDGLEKGNELITANKLKLVQDYGDYNVFVDEMAKIMENRQEVPKGDNILSVAELRSLNLKDPAQLNLLDNTIKVIDQYDGRGLRDAIMQSIIMQNSNVGLQEQSRVEEPKQVAEKTVLEKPVINVPPPMPRTPKLAEQERYAGSKLMKGNRLTPNLNQTINPRAQSSDQPSVPESRAAAQNVPPFSTFKPLDVNAANVKQGQPNSPSMEGAARAERKPSFDMPNSIEEAKTPEQVRQFMDYQQNLDREEERLEAQKDRARFIQSQRNKVVTPEIQDPARMDADSRKKARNESGYVISGADGIAQDILKETIEKTKIKDPKKIAELKEFIRQELNEYSVSNRSETIGNMMDLVLLSDMAGRRENFTSFIANELVNNKDSLKEGILVDKMQFFYKNLSQDQVGQQVITPFNSQENKKLSDPEFKYVLEALDKDKGIVATSKLRLMQEHGDYNTFTKELEKLTQKNHMTSERDGILSLAELQKLNLQDPAHIKMLEDTVKKIESYDNKGIRDAIRQSIVAKNGNEKGKEQLETGIPNQKFENSRLKTSQSDLTPPHSLSTPKVTEQERNRGVNLTAGNKYSGLDSLSSGVNLQDKSYGMVSAEAEFAKQARNKPGYAISELEPLAQDILQEIVSKVQLKEQNKIGEIREFIRQELNEYVSKNDNNAHHLMERVSLPEMTGRKQNFMNVVFNELVNNQDNLKEGMLAGKIESFYRNISEDHIGEQVVSKFDAKAKTKLSVSELYDVLEGLDQGDKIITDNKLNLMRDHGDYNAFVQGITKVIENNKLDPNIDHILSADKLKTLNLRNPEHLKMLENTIKVLEKRDVIGVLDAVKQSVITANTNPLVQSILEETVAKAKLKDTKQIGALKGVIEQELNEYVNRSGNQINNVMDMILIPKMEGRKQNFISFISNELVFDKDNLKEGSLADKMDAFYRNVSQDRSVNQVKGKFDPKTGRKLSGAELKDVLEGLEQDNKRITDNKLKLLQDHGNYDVFIQEVEKIVQKNHITPQKDNILSLNELKNLSLQNPSHLKLLENTIKGIEKYDNRGIRDAISKSIIAENDKIVNQEQSKVAETKQAPVKTILEKPVINVPPPLPRTPKLAEQPRYAGSKLMKGNRLTPNLNQTINPREQSRDQPSVPEARAVAQEGPTFSTFKPLGPKTASGSEQSNNQPKSPSISNERRQSLDVPHSIKEAKTPEQVRQFLGQMQQESRDEEKQALQKARAEFIKSQRKKVKTPEVQDPAQMEAESRKNARNKSGYIISGTEEIAQNILKETIEKTNLKDKKKIGELKEFIRQELNEYSASGRGEAISNMMDMIYLHGMEGRRQNFASFISNEIVNNKNNLKEGGLVDKIQFFYKNLSKDHTSEQVASKFDAKASKKFNEKELEYVLDALDSNTKESPFNRPNLIKEHGDYDVFVQEMAKIIKDKHLDPKADNILSIAELQNLDLKNPEHLNLLENTMKTIDKHDAGGLRTAIKLSLMKEHVGDFDSSQLNTNNMPPKPQSSRDKDVPGR